ncbi:MAG TPA: cytochrome c maturation protein CcmE [Bacteroidales bacterium]|jgi:cytochrome c-type biogenesis protein CcmE|nr:cytochrome c maturation protein CcmE [Bacteroidales bacterium]
MKKSHIIIILAIVIALGTIIVLFSSSDTYSDFTAARANPARQHQIIGKLAVNKPVIYNPSVDANSFTFYMTDENGKLSKVQYKGSKPQDFEKSEQVVITGKMENDSVFMASDLLLKCPSKYNEEKKPEQFGDKEFKAGEKVTEK